MDNRFGSVSRRSEKEIERLARDVRRELGVSPDGRISLQPVLEFALDEMVEGAYYAIEEDCKMGGAEGRTDWHQPVITISASTYVALRRAEPRARSTVAHEIGHLLMHTRQPIHFYRTKARDRHVDPEWQANYFAAALLMPATAFRKVRTVSEAMKKFGVSRGGALLRARAISHPIFDDHAKRSSVKKKGHGMTRAP